MGGGGKGSGGGDTSLVSTAPEWLDDLGEWSSGKFKENMGKLENFIPYPDMKNPYGQWESLFAKPGQSYLDSFSEAPKAAYNQALTDTKNMFGAKGLYGSVGNDMMSGAMASAGQNYATAMADAQQKAQNAQAVDYYTSAEGQKWLNQNALDKINYENTMRQQLISNYLSSMGVAVPAIMQGQTIVQDEGGGGKGGLGSALGGIGSAVGAGMGMMSTKKVKENMRPAESVLEQVKSMPVERWKYQQGVADGGEHIGPYAEDFAARFGGSAEKISIVDAIGVLFKAVQELAAENDNLKMRFAQ